MPTRPCELVENILTDNRDALLRIPAARHNHHAFVAGWLEHTLSVTRTVIYLADKYAEYYDELEPPLDKPMAVAGAILHDIGKLRELEQRPDGTAYTAERRIDRPYAQGRDIVRETAAACPMPPDTLLRLEHLIIAHQRLPEWGSPKPPMTPEALLVHYADDIDAKFHMMAEILRNDTSDGPVTSKKNCAGSKSIGDEAVHQCQLNPECRIRDSSFPRRGQGRKDLFFSLRTSRLRGKSPDLHDVSWKISGNDYGDSQDFPNLPARFCAISSRRGHKCLSMEQSLRAISFPFYEKPVGPVSFKFCNYG